MTAARSKIRIISPSNLNHRSATLILCVLDVGLAGRVCFISTIPHLPPSTPNLSSDRLITTNLRTSQNAMMIYLANYYFWREALRVLLASPLK